MDGVLDCPAVYDDRAQHKDECIRWSNATKSVVGHSAEARRRARTEVFESSSVDGEVGRVGYSPLFVRLALLFGGSRSI